MSVADFSELTKKAPEESLLVPLHNSGGRNAQGRVTSRHRGGGVKRMYRLIDWKRRKDGVSAKVVAIEYDPNRSARIALLHYEDGIKSYIVAPLGADGGDAGHLGRVGRHQARELHAPDRDSRGYAHPQHRTAAAARCPARPLGRGRTVS